MRGSVKRHALHGKSGYQDKGFAKVTLVPEVFSLSGTPKARTSGEAKPNAFGAPESEKTSGTRVRKGTVAAKI